MLDEFQKFVPMYNEMLKDDIATGKIDESKAMELGEKFFGGLKGRKGRDFIPLNGRGEENVLLTNKKTEQAHIVMGVESVSAIEKTTLHRESSP